MWFCWSYREVLCVIGRPQQAAGSFYVCVKAGERKIALFRYPSLSEKRISGPERSGFRKVPRLKEILGPENAIVSACMEAISEHLNKVVRASKVTTLPIDNWAIQNIGFLIDIEQSP